MVCDTRLMLQAFLTSVRQNYARSHKLPIDEVDFEIVVMLQRLELLPESSQFDPAAEANPPQSELMEEDSFTTIEPEELTELPESGVYVHGLWLQGGRFDPGLRALQESQPRELFSRCPILWMRTRHKPEIQYAGQVFDTPLYKTSARRGILSTTGHSTNFVMDIQLPCHHEPDHWIRRGLCLLSQVDFV
ncbi:hypothetical protein CYMTET_4766 [Cymbomonas tetramitiformis]|uniref:Dynein heavy chain C-terminal domain-containing protein n=1 Tax=Cymbomonas tetramitiformis TaxID=36881 RepID=A0AAE0H0J5_9CHLO|nr:hypothetical protein CYMTET_4766 [Cymbomonas tetramitiformis]